MTPKGTSFLKQFVFNSRFNRNFNGFIGIILLALIVLEIESLFHNSRITSTIFNELINSANRMHVNSYYANLNINDSMLVNDPSEIRISDLNNKTLIQTLRTNTIDNFFNLTVIQRKNALLFILCKKCNDSSLSIISNFNIFGIVLALVLAVLSFSFAYKYDMSCRYRVFFIPISFAAVVSTWVYFIMSVKVKLPEICNFTPGQCDSDFAYHFNSKIMPISIVMLISSPQIFIRMILLILIILKTKLLQKDYKNFHIQKFTNKRKDANNNDTNINETQQSSILISGDSSYREVPIDCPSESSNSSTQSIELCRQGNNTQNNNAFFFNFNELKPIDYQNCNMDLQATKQQSRKALAKYSSLSTIFEEKSNGSAIFSNKLRRESLLKINDFQLVKALLDDIHVNYLVLNEILHVFQPSSKCGTFQRNIPIRLSSSKAKLNSPETTTATFESSLESKFSPISYNKLTSPSKANISMNETILMDDTSEEAKRKARILKRLKNHIENIKGVSFCNLTANNNGFTISIITNPKASRRRSLSEGSLKAINNDHNNNNDNANNEFVYHVGGNGGDDDDDEQENSNTKSYYDLKLSSIFSSNILIDNSIRPVYF